MTDWHDAPCYGKQAVFFDEGNPDSVLSAKGICAVCPFSVECLEEAETYHDYNGVWGGTTPDERMIDGVRHGTDQGYAWHLRQRRMSDPTHHACRACLDAHNVASREKMDRYRYRKKNP